MKLFYFLTVAAIWFQTSLVAQTQPIASTELSFKKEIKAEFKAGDVNKYTIYLKSGQFARIRIKQETVGVGFSVFAPNDSLMEYTDLNALYQTEVITIDAKKTGNYRIEVFWDYSRPQMGYYSIVWDKVEATGNTAAARVRQIFESWYDKDVPGSKILRVSMHAQTFWAKKLIRMDTLGIVTRSASSAELIGAIKQVSQKRAYIGNDIKRHCRHPFLKHHRPMP